MLQSAASRAHALFTGCTSVRWIWHLRLLLSSKLISGAGVFLLWVTGERVGTFRPFSCR